MPSTKIMGAVIYSDAKASFDRIIENMSKLTYMRKGIAQEIAKLHAQTLNAMQYYTKTQYGSSKLYNRHMQPDPF
jgi:hypothetical protein